MSTDVRDEASRFTAPLFELNFDTAAASPNRPILSLSSPAFPFLSTAMAHRFRTHLRSMRPLFPSLLMIDRGAGTSATLVMSPTTKLLRNTVEEIVNRRGGSSVVVNHRSVGGNSVVITTLVVSATQC